MLVIDWVRIANLCDTLSCLPNKGALVDQHPSHIARLERIYAARNEWEKVKLSESPGKERQDDLKRRAAQLEHSQEDLQLIN